MSERAVLAWGRVIEMMLQRPTYVAMYGVFLISECFHCHELISAWRLGKDMSA